MLEQRTDPVDQTFYGFRLDGATGNLTVEVITPHDGSAVVVPHEGFLHPHDYRHWGWSRRTLRFQWASGHLHMRIL